MGKIIASAIAVTVAFTASSCGSGAAPDDLGAAVRAVLGNDFTGKYVKIKGLRNPAASPVYPCLSAFEVCLGLDPAGASASVKDLCPSDDTPNGTWSFSYIVYDDAACTAPLANFGCVGRFEEWISPGANHNDVVCITRNADKSFDLCVMDPITGAGSEACPPPQP